MEQKTLALTEGVEGGFWADEGQLNAMAAHKFC